MTPDARLTLRATEQVEYRYLRTVDLKDWDGFAEAFEPDATGSYGAGLEFGGAHEIVTFMRESPGPDIITVHQVHHPEIVLSPPGSGGPGGEAAGSAGLLRLGVRRAAPGC